jgi:membrane-bound lytic murein transglycosylase D
MRIALIFVLFLCCLDKTWAQSDFEVPSEIRVANQKLTLTEAYRKKIKHSADNLLRNNKYFRITVERADAYFEIVERVLQQEQAPDDLKYLSLQESKLISDVVSSSNAVGYWQFKKETAVEMGLRVDDEVDERMHIVASSKAAAKYLKRHNNYMNNWMYSVLSYYAGLGGAKKLIDPTQIGAETMVLDTNTHWYLTEFIAHKLAYENAIHRNPQPPIRVIEYTECENKTLEAIALENNVSIDDLKWYNKWARTGAVPADRDYTVIIPVIQAQPGLLTLGNVPTPTETGALKPYEETRFFGLIKVKSETPPPTQVPVTQPDGSVKYEYTSNVPLFFSWNGIKAIMARKGDNIAKLALQADIDKSDFLEYNDMRIFDLIVAGQVYYVKSKKKKAKVPFHTVQQGQTLWEISQEYGIAMKWLLKRNRMDKPEALRPGRVLWMRQTRPANVAIEYKSVYVAPSLPLKKEDSSVAKIRKNIAEQSQKAETQDSLTAKQIEVEDDTIIDNVQIFMAQETKVAIKERANAGYKVTYLKEGQTLFGLIKELGVPLDSIYAWNAGQIKFNAPIYYKEKVVQAPVNEPVTKLNAKPLSKDSAFPKPVKAVEIKKLADSVKATIKVVEPTKKVIKPLASPDSVKQNKTTPIVAPAPTKKEETSSEATYHIVEEKESMYKISKQYGISVPELLKLNGKTEPTIKVGEKLRVK